MPVSRLWQIPFMFRRVNFEFFMDFFWVLFLVCFFAATLITRVISLPLALGFRAAMPINWFIGLPPFFVLEKKEKRL